MSIKTKLLQSGNFKTLQAFFGVLAVVGIAGVVLSYYHRASNLENDRRDISRYQYPKPRHDIRGFRFDGIHDGRKVISIKADRFSIQKKKLGFFRFGLMNEARLENAAIDIYGRRTQRSEAATKFEARNSKFVLFSRREPQTNSNTGNSNDQNSLTSQPHEVFDKISRNRTLVAQGARPSAPKASAEKPDTGNGLRPIGAYAPEGHGHVLVPLRGSRGRP